MNGGRLMMRELLEYILWVIARDWGVVCPVHDL